MTATDDEPALLAAILADPADDTPRLVYADWLDEHAADPVPCHCAAYSARADNPWGPGHLPEGDGWTNCKACNSGGGSDIGMPGSVIDRGPRQDFAEFIRVQVELARLPPKPRELFVADGAGTRMEGLGVAMTPRGGGHYSASTGERGLSVETFTPGERVDIYAHLARNDRIKWMRGMKFVKHIEDRHEIIFRKDAESGKPWVGSALAARESALLAARGREWSREIAGALGVPSHEISHLPDGWLGHKHGRQWRFERGFPFSVRVPTLAEVVGDRDCNRCGGTGRHGGYTADANPGACDTCRGLGRVRACGCAAGYVYGGQPDGTLGGHVCPRCRGTRVVPPLAPRLAGLPVEMVWVADRVPEPHTWSGGTNYSWYSEGFAYDAATIPIAVFDLLTGWMPGITGGTMRRAYASRELASAALAGAVARLVRASASNGATERTSGG